MYSVSATLNNRELRALLKALPGAAQRTTTRVAQEAQQRCADTAPVRGGGLRQSHYVISADGAVDDYAARVDIYMALYQMEYGREGPALPPVEPPERGAVMACAATYGFYQEHGTRNHPAQPWFTAACEYAKGRQQRIWEEEVAALRAPV